MALGQSNGTYYKQHLVPFGEYIPKPFQAIIRWLKVPFANLLPGPRNQPLVQVHNHPIASLICYELAYPNLLRQQLPNAEWIVSISDDGWFGHSFAMYQQLQMSQVLSLMSGRYQIVSNNDGLSAIIDTQGNIIQSLPTFTADILEDQIYPATGSTPWVFLGDRFPLWLSLILVFYISALSVIRPKKPQRIN
jgi:apolipoprotein N-acyltransferase